MTQIDKLKALLDIEAVDTTKDRKLEFYLETAKWAILNRRYPTGAPSETIEKQYEPLQVRIAVEMFSKEGAEGEVRHDENGISRSYESSGISSSLLKEVIPLVKVVQ